MDKRLRFLKPRPGLKVRDPNTRNFLSEDGEIKPWTGPEGRYWRRRASRGDVIISKPLATPKVQRTKEVITKEEDK